MEITRASDYAVRVLIHLAGLPAGSMLQTSALAEAADVNVQFLSKVMQRLVRAGLVRSQRGSGGGFGLAMTAAGISVLDVVQAIEGPLRLNQCLYEGLSCDRKSWCSAHRVWVQAQAAVVGVLDAVSIAQLAEPIGSEMQNRFQNGTGHRSRERRKDKGTISAGGVR